MSHQNIQIARRIMEAWASGAEQEALEQLDPNVEFDTSARPDGRVWRGREGVREALAEWTGAFADWSIEVERYLDAGEDRVAFLWREHGRPKTGNVMISQEGITVLTIRDGIVVSFVASLDVQGTLAALGLAGAIGSDSA